LVLETAKHDSDKKERKGSKSDAIKAFMIKKTELLLSRGGAY
jgi:hypothetical protein